MPTPIARNKSFAMHILKALSPRDREVLTRFYVKGQTAQEIKEAMDLTETQFRLIKSRAKKQFAQLSQSAQLSESQTRQSAASGGTAVSNIDPEKGTAKEPKTGS
jgi:hypothetical protein